MIVDWIDRLRKRPRHERHAAALTVAAAGTGIIAILWLGGIVSKIDSRGAPFTDAQETQQASLLKAFSVQTGELQNILEEAVTSVRDFGKTIEYESATTSVN